MVRPPIGGKLCNLSACVLTWWVVPAFGTCVASKRNTPRTAKADNHCCSQGRAGRLLVHRQLGRPGAQRLYLSTLHTRLFHDGDDLLADMVEDGLNVLLLPPLWAAQVSAEPLVGLQKLVLPLLQELDLRSQLLRQVVGNHDAPPICRNSDDRPTSAGW